ncbi:phage head-tail connector protein [Methylophilus sp. Leaf414]|uniref:head-tail connector protein n=1 Tax=Methylophilus sp. Leaf414 TaxID=1736371 RepID=UPI0006FA1FC2|nr:phage head-tail connector protein [Methylophilus sp. Leaf414]KQT37682.1 hypothetical protein ASG24_01415 [Methylophilus sp. Leaf414]
MKTKLIQAPQTEPVTVEFVRKHAEIDDDIDSENILLEALISAAREHAEHICGRAFADQTWEGVLDSFSLSNIGLPLTPILSIASIKYIDVNGVEQTLNNTVYGLDDYGMAHSVALMPGQNWPAVSSSVINPIKIRFVAGYTADTVPNVVKHWICLRVAQAFKNREAYAESGFVEMPFVDRLLDSVRTYK